MKCSPLTIILKTAIEACESLSAEPFDFSLESPSAKHEWLPHTHLFGF